MQVRRPINNSDFQLSVRCRHCSRYMFVIVLQCSVAAYRSRQSIVIMAYIAGVAVPLKQNDASLLSLATDVRATALYL